MTENPQTPDLTITLMQILTYNLSLATIMADIVITAATTVIDGIMGITEVTATMVTADIIGSLNYNGCW